MESEETIQIEVYNQDGTDFPLAITKEIENDGGEYVSIKINGKEVARQDWETIKELMNRALEIWDV